MKTFEPCGKPASTWRCAQGTSRKRDWGDPRKSRITASGRTLSEAVALLQVNNVLERLEVVEEKIRQRSIIIPVQNLEPSPVEVTEPILVVVHEEDGVFIASFVDANMNASGESQLDAVEMLKDVIASSFQLFVEKEAILGLEPKRQLAVLRRFLRTR